VRLVSFLIRRMDWQTAELGRVSWHMLEDQEATARRFSHELHDELGQALTAIRTNLSALESGAHANQSGVQDCLRLVDEAIGNVRQLSQLLRPVILDDFGLEAGAALARGRIPNAHRHRLWISNRTTPAGCLMRPRLTCSASRRKR
jgi:signal transduction histidine kinase